MRTRRRPSVEPTAAELALTERRLAAEKAAKAAKKSPTRPSGRGWRGPGRGGAAVVPSPEMWRGTSVQVCGLWPYAAGTGSPMVGVPVGRNLLTGSTLCMDPISWFRYAQLISNPSMFVLGLPALGKSTLMRRIVLGLAGYGVNPLVLGDLKPDYVDLVEALGGQVIRIGRGRGHLNVLDQSHAEVAAQRVTGKAREELLADAQGRRLNMTAALITIARHAPLSDREESILDRALRVLFDRSPERTPLLGDLLRVIQEAPEDVRTVALDRGSLDRYHEITDHLEASLIGLQGGRLGDVFAKETSTDLKIDRPAVFDVSSISESDDDLRAAALLSCWSYGFGAVGASQTLADLGVIERQHFFVVMDEFWRGLRAGRGLVDRTDSLTRLNRTIGVGQAFISHTTDDLSAIPDPHERAKAQGFVERSGMVVLGGLPSAELSRLEGTIQTSRAERDMVSSWSAPPSWDAAAGGEAEPPGRGKFLVKVGGRPGIPFQVALTAAEAGINDTNKRWRAAALAQEEAG